MNPLAPRSPRLLPGRIIGTPGPVCPGERGIVR
jgi:hypothetical protein